MRKGKSKLDSDKDGKATAPRSPANRDKVPTKTRTCDAAHKSDNNYHKQQQDLVNLRHELAAELEHCQAELCNCSVEVSDDGDDPAVRTSQSTVAQTINYLAGRIREVDLSIVQLTGGSYGICIDCAGRIPRARLKVNPMARRCIRCQAVFEKPSRS